MQDFHRCNAVQSIASGMEMFTFWYITLPAASQSDKGLWFEKEWKKDLAILTGRYVGLKQAKAVELLDDSIVRGLKKGRRENLADKWLASHNPAILAGTEPAAAPQARPVAAAATSAPAQSAVAALGATAPASETASAAHVERRGPAVRRVRRRYATAYPRYDRAPREATTDDLNSEQLRDGSNGATEVPYNAYRGQYYYPAIGEQQAYPPPGVQPPPYPAATEQPQIHYQPVAQRRPPDGGSIPEQVGRGVLGVAEVIDGNLRSIAETLFGPPPRH